MVEFGERRSLFLLDNIYYSIWLPSTQILEIFSQRGYPTKMRK
jgi:hypothetical protein